MQLIDTHCHIDLDQFDADRPQVIERACKQGIVSMLVIGFERERWEAALGLADEHDSIRVSAGLHPNSADTWNSGTLDEIRNATNDKRVIAIGETGIDLYWNRTSVEVQQAAFEAQIALARELELPFVVHQRDAEREVLEILSSFSPPLRGVLHCFTGNWEYAKRILDLGMYVGLGGAITFKSRGDLHHAASKMPLDRILLETDAPYMAPVPHRGKRNEPAYIELIARQLAELQGLDIAEIARTTSANALELFPGLAGADA